MVVKQLQDNTSLEAQMQLNALRQRRQNIDNLMAQPMTEQEYAQYDDNGHYVGNNLQSQNTSGVEQAITDCINHAAQGVSLGWSDEAFGAVGGTGQVIANGLWRTAGHSTNGEGFKEAWNNGCQEYRDYARQELQDR